MNNNIVRIGLAAAAVVILAVIGINLIRPQSRGPAGRHAVAQSDTDGHCGGAVERPGISTAGRYQVDPNLPVDVTDSRFRKAGARAATGVVIGPNGNGAPVDGNPEPSASTAYRTPQHEHSRATTAEAIIYRVALRWYRLEPMSRASGSSSGWLRGHVVMPLDAPGTAW